MNPAIQNNGHAYPSTSAESAPMLRPSVPMMHHNGGATPPTSEVAERLRRTLMENFRATSDDPILANVEVVRAIESLAMILCANLEQRSNREIDLLARLDLARDYAEQETASLATDVQEARRSALEATAAFEEAKTTLAELGPLRAALLDDVQARTRERFGQGVTLIAACIAFLLVGVLGTIFILSHFGVLHAVQQAAQ